MPAAIPIVVGWVAAPMVGILGEGLAIATASFLLKSASYAALSAAATKMSRRKMTAQERQASVNSLSLGEVPREAVFGIACTGGSLVDVFNWGGQHGTDNVTFCIALADHEVDGMQGYYVDDVYYPWTGNGAQSAFSDKLILEFRNAAADGHAPPSVATTNGGWTSTDRGCGVTHMWVTVVFDDKVWTQGLPRLRWVVRGLKPFDPRHEGHDPDDPGTWTFSRNPILERYAYTRGIYATGRYGEEDQLLIGRGLTESEAPADNIIAAANVCDEQVDDISRYYADGVIAADMDFLSVEELFATAVAGTIVQREGTIEIDPGQSRAAVMTITDGDLVVGETVEFTEFLSDTDGSRINTVIPRYINVAQGYTDYSGPVRRDLDDIAEDGGPRELTLSMPIVTGGEVADRNAEIARRLGRLERRASIVLPAQFSRLEEGDWITWQSDLHHDGASVTYRIESWNLDEQWRMRLTLREIAASAFGDEDPLPDPVPAPPPPVPADALTLSSVTVEAITLPGDETTSTVPAVRFRWGEPDPAIRAIRAEIRRKGSTEIAPTVTQDVVGGELTTTTGVGPDQTLEGRLVPIGEPSRPVSPSAWTEVTTGQIIAGDVDPGSEIWDVVNNVDLRDLRSTIESLRGILDEEDIRTDEGLDARNRIDIGFDIDPVARTALIRTETLAEGTGPNGENESLVEISTRLVSFSEGAAANALLAANAYTNEFAAGANLLFATKGERADGDAQTLISAESYTDELRTESNLTFATKTERANGDALTLLSAESYTDELRTYSNGTFATQTTVGTVSATASLALSTANGDEASVILLTDVNNKITAMRFNGVNRAVDFLADYFNVTGTTGGISYSSDTQIFKIFGNGQKTVLRASGDIRFWSGPSTVADGSETATNGIIAIGPGVTGGGQYNGSTLFGPFGSDIEPGPFVLSDSAWTTVATSEDRITLNGAVVLSPSTGWGVTISSSGPLGAIDWQIISTNLSGGDQIFIEDGTITGPDGASAMAIPYSEHTYTGTGPRRFHLQLRFGLTESDTISATVTNSVLRGFYIA